MKCKQVIHDWEAFEYTLHFDYPHMEEILWECKRCGQQRKSYERVPE